MKSSIGAAEMDPPVAKSFINVDFVFAGPATVKGGLDRKGEAVACLDGDQIVKAGLLVI